MKKATKITLTVILALLLIGIAFLGGLFVLEYEAGAIEEDSVTVTIPYGAGTQTIADTLENKDVIRSAELFRITAKIADKDEKWQAGTYTLIKGDGYKEIFISFTTPQTAPIKVTIPEGLQVKTVAKLFEQAGVCDKGNFLAACDKNLYDYNFLNAVTTRTDLEGYLFPDTYYFEADTDPQIVINAMLTRFGEVMYTEEYRGRAEELGYTFDEMLTLASVVESEAKLESDRKTIAGVFFNRLNNGGKLQSCVTVEYAMGIKKNIISAKDTKFESPYNTYLYPGLPIGPICCPSEMSLKCTLWAEDTDNYYFQSDAEGTIHFAKTYEEHVATQGKVQENWEVTDDYAQNND